MSKEKITKQKTGVKNLSSSSLNSGKTGSSNPSSSSSGTLSSSSSNSSNLNPSNLSSSFRASIIVMRIISLCSCAIGGSASIYSLLIQFAETGNIAASVCWFAGLFALIGGISGYAVTNLGKREKRNTWGAVCIAFILGIAVFAFEKINLPLIVVITSAIICVVIQGILLIVAHFVLKRLDPYAL